MKNKGFTLIELLVVIAIIWVLSSVVLASLNNARIKARDTKRIMEIKQMITALEMYRLNYGQYPDSDYQGCGGWDTPGNGSFITPLSSNNLMPNISDPTTNDSCGNYRYYRYVAGDYGCDSTKGAYYVLGIVGFEGGTSPKSPGWSCPSRNWQGEFSWVTGNFEN